MKKLYVLVRKDLTLAQQAVQAGHAVAQYCCDFRDSDWNCGALVYLGVKDKYELNDWWNKFSSEQTALFYEDYYKEHTAFAILETPEIKVTLKSLKLNKFDSV